jgi:uncharacterized protein (DUF2336 family)
MVVIPDEFREGVREHLTVEQRIGLARKVKLAPTTSLSHDEQRVLGEILNIVARDAELRVRQALAETLATSPHAPRDILQTLATDDDLVASPVLMLSEILTQEDLVKLIKSQISGQKMAAIAQRKRIPPAVCLALVENGDDKVATGLLRNPGADISESGFARIIERHSGNDAVQTGIVNREALPPKIIEKAIAFISGEILSRLVERHDLPAIVSRRLVIDVRDQAVLGFSTGLNSEGMMSLLDQLISEDRLTPSLIFRSLVVGNVELIVHVIALECQLGPQYVRDRLNRLEAMTVEKLWNAANLPAELYHLALVVVEVLHDARKPDRAWTPGYCRFQIIERFTAKWPDIAEKLDPNDKAFLEAARNDALIDLAELD